MGRLVRPIPVSDADHGFSGILTLELIYLGFSWIHPAGYGQRTRTDGSSLATHSTRA
jgi:hypothetical protein